MSKDKFYTIISPTLVMRKAPEGKSEVISEGLFSEAVDVLEERGEWAHIKTLVDGYAGWVKMAGICSREKPYAGNDTDKVIVSTLSAHVYAEKDTVFGPVLTLPFECKLEAVDYKDDGSRWVEVLLPDARKAYIQRGNVVRAREAGRKNLEEVSELSRSFIGLPYTWGGRSSFGYDCSGFVQMLYRRMGIFLPRDSQDQFVFKGFKDRAVEELSFGDLIFWGHSRDEIRHVGMSLGGGEFIHTSAVRGNMPYVRMSDILDPEWSGSGYYSFVAGKTLM